MNILGLKKRFQGLIDTIAAYPVASIILGILCILFNWLIWANSDMSAATLDILGKIVMVLLVMIFLVITITKVIRKWSLKWRLFQLLILLLGGMYYIWLPGRIDDLPSAWVLQHMLIQCCVILTLLVIPLRMRKRGEYSMYDSIIHLILHSALAFIFSMILAGGVSAALFGIETLFEVSIDGEWYSTIFTTIGVIFGGLSFLDGIRIWDVKDTILGKRAKWKTMLGWVIGILLLLYALILYVYLGKILITGEWPSNQVTIWSYIFSVLVVLGSILLVPLVTSDEFTAFRNRCLNWLYGLLLPVCGMVVCAIRLRIEQYGLTEERYLVVAVLIWLVVSSVYVLFSKKKDLWIVAVVLLGIGIITTLGGPLGARGMSLHAQVVGLEKIINEHNLIGEDGKLSKEKIGLLDEDIQARIAGSIKYIVDHHGSEYISDLTGSYDEYGYKHLESLEIEDTEWRRENTSDRYFYSDSNSSIPIDIADYSRYYKNIPYKIQGNIISFTLGNETYSADVTGLIEYLESKENGNRESIPRLKFLIKEEKFMMLFNYLSYTIGDNEEKINIGVGFDVFVK